MTETERRRRRPTTACLLCRRRKTRCNRESPCSNCLRSRRKEACVYEEDEPPNSPQQRGGQQARLPHSSSPIVQDTNLTDPGTASAAPSLVESSSVGASHPEMEWMRNRIKQLEEQLHRVSPNTVPPTSVATPGSDIETATTRIGGTYHIHHPTLSGGPQQSKLLGQAEAMSHSISHKTRLFGQSHWFNAIAPLARGVVELTELHFTAGSSEAITKIQKCKSLARLIKSQRAPPWPSVPTPELPPRQLADELVKHYLRTTESLYRVLHVPSFQRDYEAVWTSLDPQRVTPFLVQLKLVFALGALTQDANFSLRPSAIRWIYEAQTYLSEPIYKSRLGIQILQTRILLLIARWLVNIGGDSVWIEVGSVIRIAITMGLHRDPAHLPHMTRLQAEMRRRLWNSILEISLQASLHLGGPPLLSMDDFDAEAPGNFDDETLGEHDASRADDSFTDTAIARILRQTFPIRLKVVKFLNDLQVSYRSYTETLRLDAEARTAFREMRRGLQRCTDQRGSPSFAILAVDLIAHRYISILHVPFYGASLHENAYAFSRKVMIDTVLKMWCIGCPSSTIVTTTPHQTTQTSTPNNDNNNNNENNENVNDNDQDLFARFITCGAGFFRTAVSSATFVIPAELCTQLQEDEGLGPAPLRTDLQAVVEEGKGWSLRCVAAGDTNAKGHMTPSLLAAHFEGIRLGLGREDLGRFLAGAAEEALDRCLLLLEQMAGQTGTGTGTGGDLAGGEEGIWVGLSGGVAPEVMTEDWDFTMPSAMLISDDQGALAWAFGDGSTQKISLW